VSWSAITDFLTFNFCACVPNATGQFIKWSVVDYGTSASAAPSTFALYVRTSIYKSSLTESCALPPRGGARQSSELRFSIIKGNDNGCANISISLNLASMQVNLFDTIQTSRDTIQTSRKIVYNSVFVTLTAFVDMSSLLIWRLKNE
jgi:hypothetical protein